jgi:hypothetical protein
VHGIERKCVGFIAGLIVLPVQHYISVFDLVLLRNSKPWYP